MVDCTRLSLSWNSGNQYKDEITCKSKTFCPVDELTYDLDNALFLYDTRNHHYKINLPDSMSRISFNASFVTFSEKVEINNCLWVGDNLKIEKNARINGVLEVGSIIIIGSNGYSLLDKISNLESRIQTLEN